MPNFRWELNVLVLDRIQINYKIILFLFKVPKCFRIFVYYISIKK